MALKKDKKKILGEFFDDARIRTFLSHKAYGDVNQDYHLIEKAYRGMKADNFSTFLTFFKKDGHDINAKNQAGITFLETISTHKKATDYAKTLRQHGAC